MFLDTSSWSGISNVIDEYIGNESIVNRASNYEDEETNINFSKSLTTRIIAIQQIVMTIYMIFALISIRRQCGQLKIEMQSREVSLAINDMRDIRWVTLQYVGYLSLREPIIQ